MAAPRSISKATITFGLVSVPVRVYAATMTSAGIGFHLLHGKDGARLRQQLVCSKDGEVVPRSEAIKGYEFERDHYVTFTDEELKELDEKATQGIEITDFVPLATVDPVYFERSYYLAPDKGGDKAFALLCRAMEELKRAQVIDLMEALKASLERGATGGGRTASATRRPPRRAPAAAPVARMRKAR